VERNCHSADIPDSLSTEVCLVVPSSCRRVSINGIDGCLADNKGCVPIFTASTENLYIVYVTYIIGFQGTGREYRNATKVLGATTVTSQMTG